MRLAWARSVSEAGNMFRILAFPLAVLAVRQDPRDLAWAESAGTVGMFLGSLLTPLLVDRFSKLRSLVAADFVALLCTAALGYGAYTASLGILLAAYFLIRAVDSYHHAALDAVTADLLQEAERPLVAGFSELQLILVGGAVAGGLAAAQAVSRAALPWLFAVDALSFVIASFWILALVRGRGREAAALPAGSRANVVEGLRSAAREWRDGFVSAFKDRETTKHLIGQSLLGVAFGLSSSTVRGHLLGTLRVPAASYAYLAPSIRGFFLAGAFLNFRFAKQAAPRTIAFLGAFLMLAGFFGMSMLTVFPLFVVCFGLQQLGNAFVVPVNRAAVMGGVAQSERGRVAAFRGLLIDGATVGGNLLAVWLIGLSTYWPLYAMAAAGLLLLLLYTTIRRWEN